MFLDQLIEEDKSKLPEFLNEFAEIYRYVLTGNLDQKNNFIGED